MLDFIFFIVINIKFYELLQVSFDVAWSAEGVDQRFYDYAAIAKYSDLIFVMAYDEQSQIWEGECTAR